jgi:hypothetical protein
MEKVYITIRMEQFSIKVNIKMVIDTAAERYIVKMVIDTLVNGKKITKMDMV